MKKWHICSRKGYVFQNILLFKKHILSCFVQSHHLLVVFCDIFPNDWRILQDISSNQSVNFIIFSFYQTTNRAIFFTQLATRRFSGSVPSTYCRSLQGFFLCKRQTNFHFFFFFLIAIDKLMIFSHKRMSKFIILGFRTSK